MTQGTTTTTTTNSSTNTNTPIIHHDVNVSVPIKSNVKVKSSTTNTTKQKSNRLKYSRPCDACSLRKVKCDLKSPNCSRCIEHGLPCTNNRVRKKCGPKKIHSKTRESILQLASSNSRKNTETTSNNHNLLLQSNSNNNAFVPLISIEKILPCLQVYQTWYYGVWPVVSVSYLMSKLINNSSSTTKFYRDKSNTDSISVYALSCALSATIVRQAFFLSSQSPLINLPNDVNHEDFANEAIRSLEFYNYRLNPSPDSLLTSFFLYGYYINIKGSTKSAISYLREAISTAQILGLQNSSTYINKSTAEIHRLRKIYYLLLVTERFICIEDHMPVILEPSIPFPSLNDEEYSTLLTGFTELVKIFAIPDKNFFDKFLLLQMNENNDIDMIKILPTRNWIINIQHQLNSIPILQETLDIQKLNILISKYWMKALTWNICKKNNLLLDGDIPNQNECLSIVFPFHIAKGFLNETKGLPLFSFESNGPGVCIKLLEIANSLVDAINLSKNYEGFQYLAQVFALISTLKNDVTLPIHLYNKIESILISHSLKVPFSPFTPILSDQSQSLQPQPLQSQITPSSFPGESYISELPDDYHINEDDSTKINGELSKSGFSPFSTHLNLTFTVPSQTNLMELQSKSNKDIAAIFDFNNPSPINPNNNNNNNNSNMNGTAAITTTTTTTTSTTVSANIAHAAFNELYELYKPSDN
ncbi:hypothetical protein DFJ63DRAFT_283861 [Scheffersomyces coipomensis]|uniref:uncharacterized protein n=1 Tax=Scheffersomyces coipomensis TaxID=1788519 RepID=UPI00315CBC4C